jgi:hypothetical protein
MLKRCSAVPDAEASESDVSEIYRGFRERERERESGLGNNPILIGPSISQN